MASVLLIAAPSSGSGKTTITAGLAWLYRRQGLLVKVFKCGPDFLDPLLLCFASGEPVDNLDLWLVGEDLCRQMLAQAARDFDVILIESVMGLFDGEPSTADLAVKFGLPVLAIIDAGAMAQTFGALAFGLAHYRADLPFYGVLANKVAGERHAQMLQESIKPQNKEREAALRAVCGQEKSAAKTEVVQDVQRGLREDLTPPAKGAVAESRSVWMGWVGRVEPLPERHLGLALPEEIPDLAAKLDAIADALAGQAIAQLGAPIEFAAPIEPEIQPLLRGKRIAIARDAAFCFIYPANLRCLQLLGAELRFFSPLAHESLPECDAVWLPGGYPELHADTLAAHPTIRAELAAHLAADKPIWAECGGMLALCESLTLVDGSVKPMWGLLPAQAAMQTRLAALGAQSFNLGRGEIRGHTFHYSKLTTELAPVGYGSPCRLGSNGEALYKHGYIKASYIHSWFMSHPSATAALFGVVV
ncbi:cobyrinic acid a,c-diamide synthase [Chitinibacter bivalviorum]|uniref:Cobyrinic acid a,c-diamide synthase n=1 Tax=Chitinibacter bivalviorum TaxID=2739434 RepID=A0A7H9BFU1_9NEIS|nr:cobyrinic acid a,c-diamide synthase [Chitinibacter bivalviorum]QLG87445.1 cobyrinic acid a,c-diamide synthase [Chitinibacter bivalviorum]